MAEIKIIQQPDKAHPFAVIYKPSRLPSAPLKEGEDSALAQALFLFPELKKVSGRKKIERGLVHRIDTATRGLLLIASTQEAYDDLSLQQKNKKFIKFYRAEVEPEGKINDGKITVTSRFRTLGPGGKMVRPVFPDSSAADKKKAGTKLYTTEITLKGNTAVCRITEGFRHQVRAHLAYCGLPVKGDALYNPKADEKDDLEFEAYRIEFINPATGNETAYEL